MEDFNRDDGLPGIYRQGSRRRFTEIGAHKHAEKIHPARGPLVINTSDPEFIPRFSVHSQASYGGGGGL